jgi:Zn-dependent metalloprotease
MHRRFSIAATAVAVLGMTASAAHAATPGDPTAAAQKAADFVKGRPSKLHANSSETLHQHAVIGTKDGLQYVPYDRSYKGLKVRGGDFVVVTDANGDVVSTSLTKVDVINLDTTPQVPAGKAAQAAEQASTASVDSVSTPQLIVDATRDNPTLAYETVVEGHKGVMPSKLHVITDADTGQVISTQDEVLDGTGTGWINGPTPLSIATTQAGTVFSMRDPTTTNLSCQDAANNSTFSGPDDAWGSGVGTNRETACVDALFDAQKETQMLSAWLGRNGFDGAGGGWPIRVGLNDQNAFYDGTQVQIGHNTAGQWIASLDVVGHELGHGIDDHTPGGISGGNTQEAVADIFGALTEWYANEPAPYDTPDFSVGEKINLVGSGPIRQMYNPSLVGDANCYSSATPSQEVHAAAGPMNHWFYLLAMGTNPTNGQPTSPTCNNTQITGLGIQTAGKIFYNAMLMKTTGSSYLKYRTWTLNAAKNLTPGNCATFNTVKAAWDAVSVPAQAADPTCTIVTQVTVNSPGNQSTGVGTPASVQMTATAPAGTLTWSATGLPTGLSINASTGLISGTPTTLGTYTVAVKAVQGTLSNTATFTWTIAPQGSCPSPGNKIVNGGFESGNTPWTATAGALGNTSGQTAHGGTKYAWLDGYGTTHTDTLQQTITLPAGCTAYQFTFFLHIDSAETTTTTQFDKLTVQANTTTLGTFSNLNKATGYTQRTFDLKAFAGQTVTIKFTGTEDTSLQTSFVIDDAAVNVS